jgi:hypothetical protein
VVHSYKRGLQELLGDKRMKDHHAQVLDHLVAAKRDKQFREKLNKRSYRVLGGNTSPSEASYSASICCSTGPRAL